MGADVEGAVFAIVTCTMAPKTFSKSGGGAASYWDIEKASRSREDRTIITELYYERTIGVHGIFVQTVFRVDGSEGGGCIGQSRGRDSCE